MKVFFPGPYSPPQQPAYSCTYLLLWTTSGQCWAGGLSRSFLLSTLASTGDKHQGQPANQGEDLKEISRKLQTCIIMPAQSFSWIHVKFSSWLAANHLFLLRPEQPPVGLQTIAPAPDRLAGTSLQAAGSFSTFIQPLPELWHLLRSSPSSSRGACSCCPQHENQGLACNPTRGRIRPPCRTSAYQLVTLTDSICRESLWKMQSIIQALLIFCFCCIYSWFMALRGG